MVTKKLSIFQKLVLFLGKYLMWYKFKKMNTLTAAKITQATLEELIEINNGDTLKGMKEFEEIIGVGSTDFVDNMFTQPVAFGISATSTLSKNIPDYVFLFKTVMYALQGSAANEMFEDIKYYSEEESDDGIAQIVLTIKKCMVCCEPEKFSYRLEELGVHNPANFFPVLIKSSMNWFLDYIELDKIYTLEARETKCFLRGDGIGEWKLWFLKEGQHPPDPPDKKIIHEKGGDPAEFMKWNINSMLVGLIYPTLLARLVREYGGEKTKIRLNKIGKRISELVVDKYEHKHNSFSKIMKDFLNKFMGLKCKIATVSKGKEYMLTTKYCHLCDAIEEEIEGLDNIHYCETYTGVIEGFYNLMPESYPELPIKKIKVTTVESRGSGAKKCKYRLEVIE